MKCMIASQGAKYYKYVDVAYNQPVITSNGTVGISEIATWAGSSNGSLWGSIYGSLYNCGGSLHCYADEYYAYIHLYMWLKQKVKVTGLKFYAIQDGSSGRGAPARNITLWGSNDGNSWTQYFYNAGESPGYPRWKEFTFSNDNYYHYHRLQVGNNGNSYNDLVAFSNVKLEGSYQTLIESTEEDYDIYTNLYGCSVAELNNKYYAVKGENDVL